MGEMILRNLDRIILWIKYTILRANNVTRTHNLALYNVWTPRLYSDIKFENNLRICERTLRILDSIILWLKHTIPSVNNVARCGGVC